MKKELQLCWSCCCKDCEWVADLKPVKRWQAEKVKVENVYINGVKKEVWSYHIKKCPKYQRWEKYFEYYNNDRHAIKSRDDVVLSDFILSAISEQDALYLTQRFIEYKSVKEICEINNVAQRTYYRLIKKAKNNYNEAVRKYRKSGWQKI